MIHCKSLLLVILLFSGFTFKSFAQETASSLINKIADHVSISGYTDVYYANYSDSAGTDRIQKFGVISPKSNEFGINIVQLSAQYTAEKIRATTTLHYGDIPAGAWSVVNNFIQEANIGFRVHKKIWLDAGLFKTHIGTEALLPKDNIASSLAMISYYEPWFQAGVKLTYTANDQWLICLHILNGYNIFNENNQNKSIGGSVSYTINPKGSISYYNLVGDELPDSKTIHHVRFLNNLVFSYQLTSKLKTIIGVDYILQQHARLPDQKKSSTAYGGIVAVKYQLKPLIDIYARADLFSDKNGFLSGTIINTSNELTGLKESGYTAGVQYKPTLNSYIRLEGRDMIMNHKQKIFTTNGVNTNHRFEVMVNAGIWF